MNGFDDSDMKIATGKNDEREARAEASDEAFLAEQRENGNLERAQKLGLALAEQIDVLELSNEGKVLSPLGEVELNSERVLMIFSTVAAIEDSMQNELLTRTALNAFYHTLKNESPMLYDYMSSSGAFSFYYLEYRRENKLSGELAANVAKAFAMLCGRENDEALLSEGRRIFDAYYYYSRKLAEEYVPAE